MFDQLESMITKYAAEAVSKSKDVPSDKSSAVTNAATGSIMDLVKQKASSNDLSGLTQMFGSESGVQSAVSQLSGGFVEKLIGQGFSSGNAKGLASTLLPMILSNLMGNKGGSGGGMLDMLTKLGGKGDMGSLLGGLMGGSKGKSSNDGGIMGKMKDLLG